MCPISAAFPLTPQHSLGRHALVTNGKTNVNVAGANRVRDVTEGHETRAAETVNGLGGRRLREPGSERRRADLVAGRRGVAGSCGPLAAVHGGNTPVNRSATPPAYTLRLSLTGNNVLDLLGLDARLGDTRLEHLVQEAIGRGVAEAALLRAGERGAAGVLLSASSMESWAKLGLLEVLDHPRSFGVTAVPPTEIAE